METGQQQQTGLGGGDSYNGLTAACLLPHAHAENTESAEVYRGQGSRPLARLIFAPYMVVSYQVEEKAACTYLWYMSRCFLFLVLQGRMCAAATYLLLVTARSLRGLTSSRASV